ncbi:MAG: helix-turn-helix domain-containing protein [Gaiellaceae bacterium]|jgi:excisionase family DNA binding protein
MGRKSRHPTSGLTLAGMLEHENKATVASQLLTIGDVQGLLRVSRTTVYELIRRGDLVPIRVGQRFRFSPVDIRAYLERSRQEIAP